MINLHDDFLTNVQIGQLREQFFFGGIPWYYNESKVSGAEDDINNYQFTHVFYETNSEARLWTRSEHFPAILPILSRLSVIGIYRIKANLEPLKVGLNVWMDESKKVTNEVSGVDRYYSEFHTDYSCDNIEYSEYKKLLEGTAVSPSPFGLGEICYRDFEILFAGSVLIKPNMDHLKTWPNIYKPMETYIPCKWDFSDLEEKVSWVFNNISEAQNIATSGQDLIKDLLLKQNNFSYQFKNIIDMALKTDNC